MLRSSITLLAALVAAAVLPGCATIFTGTSDTIRFESEPEGARIFIDGIERGRTPASVSVSRSAFDDKQVTLRLDGYEDRTFVLDKRFNAVSILNLAGLLGWGVDFATGAVMKYDPEMYSITLDSERAQRLDNLERDAYGHYLIPAPEGGEAVTVTDAESGVTLVFER